MLWTLRLKSLKSDSVKQIVPAPALAVLATDHLRHQQRTDTAVATSTKSSRRCWLGILLSQTSALGLVEYIKRTSCARCSKNLLFCTIVIHGLEAPAFQNLPTWLKFMCWMIIIWQSQSLLLSGISFSSSLGPMASSLTSSPVQSFSLGVASVES